MISTPPAYSQTPGLPLAPSAVNTAHAHQNHGYNQQHDPNVGQGYSFGQQPYSVNPGYPQIIYASQPVSSTYDNYKSRQSVVLGTCKIIIGILCIAFNAAFIAISHFDNFSFVGYGIWGGVLLILAGAFGVAGGKRKAKCLIVTYMVMCIFAALAAAAIFSLGILDIWISDGHSDYRKDYTEAKMAMSILLVILSAIAGVMCIWGSTLSCRVSCCTQSASQSTFVAQNQPVQFVQWNGNSQILLVAQPNSTSQGMPIPGYPIQVAANAPAYQPLMNSHANPINGGIPTEPAEKRPCN